MGLSLFATGPLLAVGLGVSFSAHARVDRQESVIGEAETEERESVLEDARSGPTESYDWFQRPVAIEEIERTETAIRRLSELVRDTPVSNPQRAEFMFRLAELYTERTRFYEERAYQRRDEAFLEEANNPQRAAAYRRAAEGDLQQSERFARDAAQLYGDLYQNYRGSFEQMDAVLFYLGSNFLQYNQRTAAVQIYEELARSFPTSAFIPQAMLMLGEIAFEDGNLESALAYYELVIQTPDSSAYPYGLYKKSWCLYNLARNRRDFVRALETLYDAVTASRERESQGASALSLTRQALRDVPLFYSEVYEGRVAPAFFDRIAPDTADDLLERLGRIYGDKAMYSDSNAVFRALIARHPDSFRSVGWQTEVVRNTRPSASEVETVREMRRLVNLYVASLEFPDVTDALKKEISENIEFLLRQTATTYHREAQVTQNEHYYALAFNLYSDYIATFPEGKEAYTMWYYYAELLYRNQDWVQAAAAFEKVLELGGGEGEHDADASYSACISYTKMIDLTRQTDAVQDDVELNDDDAYVEIPAPEPIPEEYTRMMTACDAYLATNSDPELSAELDFAVTFVYYDYNHLDEAVRRFKSFALERSDVDMERAQLSADIVLEALSRQHKWSEMRETIAELQRSRVNTGELADRLRILSEQVSFRECREMMIAENYEGSSYCFFNFVNDNMGSDYVDTAILNAAISFREIDNLDYSVSLLEQLPVLRPNSPHVPTTLYELGLTFSRLAVYETAADYFDRYVSNFRDGEYAQQAALSSAMFRTGLGQHSEAISALNNLIRVVNAKHPEDEAEIVAEANYQIALVRDQRGDGSEAIQAYTRFIQRHGDVLKSRALEAIVRVGDMYMDRRSPDRGWDRYRSAVKFYEDLNAEERAALSMPALDAVSKAAFLLADRIYDEFERVSLDRRTPDQIRAAVEEKLRLGSEAAAAFDPIIRVYSRPGWMIAALTRLGQLNHVFYLQLADAPVPEGLPPLVEEEYRTELENRMAQIKDESASFYLEALAKARENGWFNEWSELAGQKLQELDPSFASGSELRVEPGFDNPGPYMATFAGALGITRERQRAAESARATEDPATPEDETTTDGSEQTTTPASAPEAAQ